MDVRALRDKQLFAAVVFVASSLVLALQLITPSPVMVSVGENGTKVAELGGYFSYRAVGTVAVASCLLGSSGTYLLVDGQSNSDSERTDSESVGDRDEGVESSDELLETRRREWQEVADELVDNEQVVYETVLEADGVLAQNEIVERTDLSKATVSRVLDNLESKNLAERKRHGMGNRVVLL
ncbi:MarR family transcriptional regulator [Halorussus sp. MSC15.2]|uniref:helix-turn-helix transcriptional regulator n=1 Tax=Halorussus sp. MSC15.2 TaxID=2283638 RepID=UPI0013D81F81|nr:MarR family transcriptional regulator [Halorussus sp. MSC15.2]NEU55673.1 MarR family transcriptional regulator [Halorussus sp. MSC15.2]